MRERRGEATLLLLPVTASYDASVVLATTSIVEQRPPVSVSPHQRSVCTCHLTAMLIQQSLKYVNSDDPCVLPKNDIEVVKQSNVGLLLKIYLRAPTLRVVCMKSPAWPYTIDIYLKYCVYVHQIHTVDNNFHISIHSLILGSHY